MILGLNIGIVEFLLTILYSFITGVLPSRRWLSPLTVSAYAQVIGAICCGVTFEENME